MPNSTSIMRLGRWSRRLDEALSLVPVVGLAIVAALLLFPGARVEPASPSGPSVTRELQFGSPAGEEVPLVLIAVGAERAGQLRQLLEAEAALRNLIEEPPRRAEVAQADDPEHAERIAESVRTQLDVLGTSVSAQVVP